MVSAFRFLGISFAGVAESPFISTLVAFWSDDLLESSRVGITPFDCLLVELDTTVTVVVLFFRDGEVVSSANTLVCSAVALGAAACFCIGAPCRWKDY